MAEAVDSSDSSFQAPFRRRRRMAFSSPSQPGGLRKRYTLHRGDANVHQVVREGERYPWVARNEFFWVGRLSWVLFLIIDVRKLLNGPLQKRREKKWYKIVKITRNQKRFHSSYLSLDLCHFQCMARGHVPHRFIKIDTFNPRLLKIKSTAYHRFLTDNGLESFMGFSTNCRCSF